MEDMMQNTVTDIFVQRIHIVHRSLLASTEEESEADLCRYPAHTTPPIGWHLWHISRWADRLQASLPRNDMPPNFRPDADNGIWEQEKLVQRWDLNPETLGTLETGLGMEFDAAAALPGRIGKAALLPYARRSFSAVDAALADLSLQRFVEPRLSIAAFQMVDGKPRKAAGHPTTLVGDLGFHFSHANRHLGMIEALRGLFGSSGTASF